MHLEENPYTVPHLKALNSGQKLWGRQRWGSTIRLKISILLHISRSQRFILNAFVYFVIWWGKNVSITFKRLWILIQRKCKKYNVQKIFNELKILNDLDEYATVNWNLCLLIPSCGFCPIDGGKWPIGIHHCASSSASKLDRIFQVFPSFLSDHSVTGFQFFFSQKVSKYKKSARLTVLDYDGFNIYFTINCCKLFENKKLSTRGKWLL